MRVTLVVSNELEASALALVGDGRGADDFISFFGGLADLWSGWEGERSWASPEGHVELAAVSDRTGHVRLSCTFHPVRERGLWTASSEVHLEAGGLGDLHARIRSLMGGLPSIVELYGWP